MHLISMRKRSKLLERTATAWTDEAKIEKCYKKFKTLFSEPEPWTPEEKNRLWNYTLLDSSTNRGYGNAIFSAKRRIILSKCNGKLLSLPREKEGKLVFSSEGEKAESAFIPLCTERVFSKQYSPTTGDSNYWTKIPDAQKYLDNIKDCIEQLKEAEENHEQTEG